MKISKILIILITIAMFILCSGCSNRDLTSSTTDTSQINGALTSGGTYRSEKYSFSVKLSSGWAFAEDARIPLHMDVVAAFNSWGESGFFAKDR